MTDPRTRGTAGLRPLGRGVAGAADAARVVEAQANVALADPLLIKLLLEEQGPREGSLLVRIENPSAKAPRDGQVNAQAHLVEGGGVSETGSRLRLVDPWDRRFGAELQDLTGSEEAVDQWAADREATEVLQGDNRQIDAHRVGGELTTVELALECAGRGHVPGTQQGRQS